MRGMAPLGLPWSYLSSSSDPAHGTREGAGRSMRHANSPRRPRPLFSLRRFRHTAVSPPLAMRAILSHSRIPRGWRLSHHRVRDTVYLATERRSEDLTAVSGTVGHYRQPPLAGTSGGAQP